VREKPVPSHFEAPERQVGIRCLTPIERAGAISQLEPGGRLRESIVCAQREGAWNPSAAHHASDKAIHITGRP
jgi:hypothetical protein